MTCFCAVLKYSEGGGYGSLLILMVRQLYADLLAIEVFNYLSQNQVEYYFVRTIGQIKNIQDRGLDIEGVASVPSILSKHRDYLILKDISKSDKMNIIGGQRFTTNVPKHYNNSIYFYGPCTALGAFTVDDKTIESYLQRALNSENYPYRIVNFASVGSGEAINNDLNSLYMLMDTKFKEGDKIIHFGQTIWNNIVKLPEEKYLGFSEIFSTPPFDTVSCFELSHSDHMVHSDHINEDGNRVLAEVIFNRIKSKLTCSKSVTPFFERIKRYVKIDSELEEYLIELSKEKVKVDNIGAIVMNCNPFTRGHMYLIEQALKQVEFLYVFVVEEDLSEFSFKDRFAIVKENCRGFNNVKVLPSGRYMISSFTFAEYFKKDDLQDQNIIPVKDVNLFGSAIAPCLNIKTRFVGEEPFDKVTRQYNEAMKRMLGDFGINLVEIPRLQFPNGEVINATKVRRLLKEGNIKACRAYLTEATYSYIIKSDKYNPILIKE